MSSQRFNPVSPIRCPQCAHRLAVVLEHPPKNLRYWLKWLLGRAPRPKTHPVYWNGVHYVFNGQKVEHNTDLTCERCGATTAFLSWVMAGAEPIKYFDWWETMCECGGEMWMETTHDEQIVVYECERCGAKKTHKFSQ